MRYRPELRAAPRAVPATAREVAERRRSGTESRHNAGEVSGADRRATGGAGRRSSATSHRAAGHAGLARASDNGRGAPRS